MSHDVMDWVDGYRFIEEHACDSEIDVLLKEYEKNNRAPTLLFTGDRHE